MAERNVSAIGAVLVGTAAGTAAAIAVLFAGGGALYVLLAYMTISTAAIVALVAPPVVRQAAFLRSLAPMHRLALGRR